jgi:hypothetical protein
LCSLGLLSRLLRGFKRSLLRCLLGGLLGGSLRSLLSGQLRSLLTRELLSGLKRGLAGSFLCGRASGPLRRKLRCSALLFFGSRGLCNAYCFSFLARLQPILFHGFLNSLPGLLARLCS